MQSILQFIKRKYRKLRYGTELTEEDYKGIAALCVDPEGMAKAMQKAARKLAPLSVKDFKEDKE